MTKFSGQHGAIRVLPTVLLLCCSFLVLGLTYKFVHFWMSAPAGPARTVFYEVKPNAHPLQIARDLEKEGVVSSAKLFYYYARLTGKTPKFKAGDYRFTTAMKPDEVLAVIMSGVSFGVPLTVPEGYTVAQVGAILETIRPGSGSGARFTKLCSDREFISKLGLAYAPKTLEGYLFPDTYLIERNRSEEEIIRNMVRKFQSVFSGEWEERARALKYSMHQVVTLASIVEKETGAVEERPLISSVFHNRLKKRMRLQSDPTVIYGLNQGYGGANITKRDLETLTPYNTYRVYGLPPGPIANPGREAIQATLFPAETEYLYFVSRNDGTHEFTSTYENHQRAVTRFQLDRRARTGKSWRDLQKRQAGQAPLQQPQPVSR